MVFMYHLHRRVKVSVLVKNVSHTKIAGQAGHLGLFIDNSYLDPICSWATQGPLVQRDRTLPYSNQAKGAGNSLVLVKIHFDDTP